LQFYTVRCKAQQNPSLDNACRIFQSMVRSAYNQLLHGAKQPEVASLLLERYGIQNYLWRKNTIFQAKAIIGSQRELLPLHIQELNWKIGQVQKKLNEPVTPSRSMAMRCGSQSWRSEKPQSKPTSRTARYRRLCLVGENR